METIKDGWLEENERDLFADYLMENTDSFKYDYKDLLAEDVFQVVDEYYDNELESEFNERIVEVRNA